MIEFAKKEIREQLGLIVVSLGSIILFGLLHLVMRMMDIPGYISTVDALFTFYTLMWIVVVAAATCGSVAGERDRGTDSFVQALPISGLKVWSIKLVIVVLTVLVLIGATLIMGCVLGYGDLYKEAWSKLHFIAQFLLVVGASALFTSSIFKKAMTALITAVILGIGLSFLYGFIIMYWMWWENPPTLSANIALLFIVVVAAWIYLKESRNIRFSRLQYSVIIPVAALFIVGIFSIEYHLQFYRKPVPGKAEVVALLPDAKNLLIQADSFAPAYTLNIHTGKYKRIAKRFGAFVFGRWDEQFSPSGKYFMSINRRQLFGGAFWLFGSRSNSENEFEKLGSVLWQEKSKNIFTNWDIVNTETGQPIFSWRPKSNKMRIYPRFWHPEKDHLIADYGPVNKKKLKLGLFRPNGELIRSLLPEGRNYFTINRDGKTVIRVDFGTGPEYKHYTYYYQTIDEDNLHPDAWREIQFVADAPYVSPAGNWAYTNYKDNSTGIWQLSVRNMKNDREEMEPIGLLTSGVPLAAWSEQGSYLLFNHDNQQGDPVLSLYYPETREFKDLQNPISDELSGILNVRHLFAKTSFDERFLAVGYSWLESKIYMFDVRNSTEIKSWDEAGGVGWIAGNRFLYISGGKLMVWDSVTRREFEFSDKKGGRIR